MIKGRIMQRFCRVEKKVPKISSSGMIKQIRQDSTKFVSVMKNCLL